jgi:hypothetical protein
MKRTLLAALLFAAPAMLVRAQDTMPPAPPPAASASQTAVSYTGSWRVDGDVQGQPVKMLCSLVQDDKNKITGSCTAEADDTGVPRKVAGEVKKGSVNWHFDTVFQDNPISVAMSATMSDDGKTMSGTIDVEPMGVGGEFNAVRLQPKAATPAP